ncbi:hypothetical protein CONPUDRAFT_53744, partial [Coniophora puteana RWD-64-598 SS2]
KVWQSVFTAVGVISNRISVPHLDTSGCYPWFDILFTSGDYEGGVLDLLDIGIQFAYVPGALVPLCGKIFRHQVPKVEGNRVCSAFYMRRNVHQWAATGEAQYSDS